jgi:hypothetical protein
MKERVVQGNLELLSRLQWQLPPEMFGGAHTRQPR